MLVTYNCAAHSSCIFFQESGFLLSQFW